ncbi:MAG: LysM peptidoglycan-binding domain-containing protein [Akkermansiaceae bacterium]
MKPLLLITLFVAGCFPSFASANDRGRIDQLEREVSQLRQQVSELSRRIVSLRGKAISEQASRASQAETSFYTIQRGDSLWSLARRMGTTVTQLETLNPGLNPRRMGIGKTIRVARKKSNSPRSPLTPLSSSNYRVKSGDTLGGIAARRGLRLKTLLNLNPEVHPDRIQIGQKIRVRPFKSTPSSAPPPAVAAHHPMPTPKPSSSPVPRSASIISAPYALARPQLVVVSENRRLDEIARFYRTDVATINELNHVSLSPAQIIKIGSQIYVPKQ